MNPSATPSTIFTFNLPDGRKYKVIGHDAARTKQEATNTYAWIKLQNREVYGPIAEWIAQSIKAK